jgi:hypothetical protein
MFGGNERILGWLGDSDTSECHSEFVETFFVKSHRIVKTNTHYKFYWKLNVPRKRKIVCGVATLEIMATNDAVF